MTEKCIDCGKFISKDEDTFCKKCLERQKNNPKLQKLLHESVHVPLK